MKSTRLIYQIRSSSLSQPQLAQPKLSHSCRGGKLLSRITRGANIFINVCSAYLPLPPPPTTTFDDTNWLKFFGRKFFVAVKIVVEIFMAHAMLTNEDPARTQREPSAKAAQLIGYSAQELLTQCAAFACSTRPGSPSPLVPRSPSLRLDIMLGRKFFSQILNCRSGINKREK